MFVPNIVAGSDIDGDGYYESTQWFDTNTAVITIDVNNNGIVDAGEILNLNENTNARNSSSWLDINNDNILDKRDPAFSALKVWLDVNSDGISVNTREFYSNSQFKTAS